MSYNSMVLLIKGTSEGELKRIKLKQGMVLKTIVI